METTQDSYFTAYRHLKLTRDAQGVLLVQMHDDGGRSCSPLKLTPRLRTPSTEFPKIERTRL
jgi:hypothetical protein